MKLQISQLNSTVHLALLHMDKILKGETLEETIIRVLKNELPIADDFIRAFVPQTIEFDRDREGILTPRLVVYVYVKEIKDRKWVEQKTQTSWKSYV